MNHHFSPAMLSKEPLPPVESLADYHQALRACLPRGSHQPDVVVPELLAHLGRLQGIYAHALRDRLSQRQLQAVSGDAYGEVCRLAAMLLDTIPAEDGAFDSRGYEFPVHLRELDYAAALREVTPLVVRQVMRADRHPLLAYDRREYLRMLDTPEMRSLWPRLRYLCPAITGQELDEVLTDNLVMTHLRLGHHLPRFDWS